MDYLQALARWQELKESISHLQQEERALREGLFQGTFPEPEEGVNTYQLPDGRVVKGTYKLTRTLDMEALEESYQAKKITKKTYEGVQKIKVTLDLAAFKKLSDKQRMGVEQALTVKPALPQLSVVDAEDDEG